MTVASRRLEGRISTAVDEWLIVMGASRSTATWTQLLLSQHPTMVDARYEKARVDGQVVDVAVLVAVGVGEDGYRRVLGVNVVFGETEQTWSEFFGSLRERGLSGVQLMVSDDHADLGWARRGTPPPRRALT